MAPDFIIFGLGEVKVAPPDLISGQHYHCWTGGKIFDLENN
jgi:hypothetical protein